MAAVPEGQGNFPRRMELPDPHLCPDSSLHARTRNASNLADAVYWAKVCPGLHVSGSLQPGKPLELGAAVLQDLRQQMDSEGVVQVRAVHRWPATWAREKAIHHLECRMHACHSFGVLAPFMLIL